MTMLMSHLSSRNQLPKLLNELGLTGAGVEVGTHRGEYAKILLSRSREWGGVLYCVDPWRDVPGYEYQAEILRKHLSGARARDEDYRAARRLLAPHEDRVVLVRDTSAGAAATFNDGDLDFAYIDGDHQSPHPYDDCARWWPKLKAGGVLAGHDFLCPGQDPSWGRHVQPAVLRFAHEAGDANVYLIVEEGNLPWSYYIIKPKGGAK